MNSATAIETKPTGKNVGKWNWWQAARTSLAGSQPAMTWWQMAMIATAAGAIWSVGGHMITHAGVRVAFYAGMCLYMAFVVWLNSSEPVERYGWLKTFVVTALVFALPAMAPNVAMSAVGVIISLLFARAFIGIEENLVGYSTLALVMTTD